MGGIDRLIDLAVRKFSAKTKRVGCSKGRFAGFAPRRIRSVSAAALEKLSRVYWFTIEFGVLREDEDVKAYGTGLLSSAGEMAEMHKAELRPFDLDAAAAEKYDPTRFQPVLFCADSFGSMYQTLRDYLGRW